MMFKKKRVNKTELEYSLTVMAMFGIAGVVMVIAQVVLW